MNKNLYLSLIFSLYSLFSPIYAYPVSYDHQKSQSCIDYENRVIILRKIRERFLNEVDILKRRGEEPKLHIDYINDLEKRLKDLESKIKGCKK